jgi:TfoX/Sxy family transcriptional regulator of competence genes
MAYDEQLARRVREILQGVPGLIEKKMFGGVGYIVNGNMACGINGEHLIVRLSEKDSAQALAQPGVNVFDMTGRPMKGWITVAPAGFVDENDLKAWIERGLQFAQSLPPK